MILSNETIELLKELKIVFNETIDSLISDLSYEEEDIDESDQED